MKKFDSINVIPFIDIMLVLLAIVMTTATFVTHGQLDITLPQSSSQSNPDQIERVEIALNQQGVMFINGKEHSLAQAELQLKLLTIDTPILLLIDESVEFRQFVSVVDLLKTLTLDKVSVLTRANS